MKYQRSATFFIAAALATMPIAAQALTCGGTMANPIAGEAPCSFQGITGIENPNYQNRRFSNVPSYPVQAQNYCANFKYPEGPGGKSVATTTFATYTYSGYEFLLADMKTVTPFYYEAAFLGVTCKWVK